MEMIVLERVAACGGRVQANDGGQRRCKDASAFAN
jgi:hypothetical protein